MKNKRKRKCPKCHKELQTIYGKNYWCSDKKIYHCIFCWSDFEIGKKGGVGYKIAEMKYN